MTYHICNGLGDSMDTPSVDEMRLFLEGLDPADEEHGAAWLSVESGYSLTYEINGNLRFDPPDGEPRHLTSVPARRVLELWLMLVQSRFDELEREPWLPGARDPIPPEELARRQREYEAWQRADDRRFYDLLGPERDGARCASPECSRGIVSFSVFCRCHHFERLRGRSCPFED